VRNLSYNVNAKKIERYRKPNDFSSLIIPAEERDVTINLDLVNDWTSLLVSLLNRVAELGHLKRLRIIVVCWEEYSLEWSDSEQSDSDDDEPSEIREFRQSDLPAIIAHCPLPIAIAIHTTD
jgi:hypothetical protein